MKANKNSVGSERKNIYREANIDINIDKDSDKSPQSKLHKIALNQLIKEFLNEKFKAKDFKDLNKSLKKEIQIYKDEQNKKYNQKNLPVNGINLIIINKDETIEKLKEENKRLKEENKRLKEEIHEKNRKIETIEFFKNEALRQIIVINANRFLRNESPESKKILKTLQEHNPNLYFDNEANQKEEEKSEEKKSEEEKPEEEKSEEESMRGNPVDNYISSKNNEAKNQNNNIDDLKTEDDTANLKHIDFNEQHI
jgi:hypothetical protein